MVAVDGRLCGTLLYVYSKTLKLKVEPGDERKCEVKQRDEGVDVFSMRSPAAGLFQVIGHPPHPDQAPKGG